VTGLGAITPIYTVTVKTRVTGQLMSVHFKEGDLVNKDDPLIEIDPRPQEAVVVQAQGALVRDHAVLANAQVDLTRYQALIRTNAIPERQLATQEALVAQYEGSIIHDVFAGKAPSAEGIEEMEAWTSSDGSNWRGGRFVARVPASAIPFRQT
jgi:membrane fusion protein, multidrug efflux system